MTGIFPAFGVGALMAGSTFGGQMTPFDWASLSLSVSLGAVCAPFAQAFASPGRSPDWTCAKADERTPCVRKMAVKRILTIAFTPG